MRWLPVLVLAACSSSHGMADGAVADAPADAGCGCLGGARQVTGSGDRFRVEATLVVDDCGTLACEVDGAPHTCFLTSEPALRVYLDRDGYVQLVFPGAACGASWDGSYATEAGGAVVRAELLP